MLVFVLIEAISFGVMFYQWFVCMLRFGGCFYTVGSLKIFHLQLWRLPARTVFCRLDTLLDGAETELGFP